MPVWRRSSRGAVNCSGRHRRAAAARSLFRYADAVEIRDRRTFAFQAFIADEVVKRGTDVGFADRAQGQILATGTRASSAHGDTVVGTGLTVDAALKVVLVLVFYAGTDFIVFAGSDIFAACVGALKSVGHAGGTRSLAARVTGGGSVFDGTDIAGGDVALSL